MPHLVATLVYLSQIYSYYIRGDRSPLTLGEGSNNVPVGKKVCDENADNWGMLKQGYCETAIQA